MNYYSSPSRQSLKVSFVADNKIDDYENENFIIRRKNDYSSNRNNFSQSPQKNKTSLEQSQNIRTHELLPEKGGEKTWRTINDTTTFHQYHHENNKNNYDGRDNGEVDGTDILFSSPPVTTPTRSGMISTPTKSPACISKGRDNIHGHDYYYDDEQYFSKKYKSPRPTDKHVRQLEEALRIETQRREAAEREVTKLLLVIQNTEKRNKMMSTTATATATATTHFNDGWLSKDNLVHTQSLLDRASKLLSRKIRNNHDDSYDNDAINNKMYDYHELSTAFYAEQKVHSELDGEEFVAREDIVWLLHELKWRYEDILTNYELRKEQQRAVAQQQQFDYDEMRGCVSDLVVFLEKVNKLSTPTRNSDDTRQDNNGDSISNIFSSMNTNDVIMPNNEQSTNTAQTDMETNIISDHPTMDTIKLKYQEQITNMCQLVSDLESKLIDQEDGERRFRETVEKERHKFAMSSEGNIARIRYLEGMLHSLEMELKSFRASRMMVTDDNGGTQFQKPQSPTLLPFRPIFMRNHFTSDHNMQHSENHAFHTTNNTTSDETILGVTASSNDNSDETILSLRNQISSLGISLAESETDRANLIEEFEKERLAYMAQFKQMSELLKQFTER